MLFSEKPLICKVRGKTARESSKQSTYFKYRQCGRTLKVGLDPLDTNISKNGLNMFPEFLKKCSKTPPKISKYPEKLTKYLAIIAMNI